MSIRRVCLYRKSHLLSWTRALARKLKETDGYYNHGGTILCALQNVRDRLNGRNF